MKAASPVGATACERVPGSWPWLALAGVVVVADQATKALIVDAFGLGEVRPLTSFFSLVRVHNAGAAFSFLADASGWQRWFFTVLGVAVSAFIVWMIRQHPQQRLLCAALGLVMGGAIGNVVDRLVHGHVVDFLQFRFGFLEPLFQGGYFPAFNVADSAITVGAAGLILDELRRLRRPR